MLSISQSQSDAAAASDSHYVLAVSSFFIGDLAAVREHTERALAIYHTTERRPLPLHAMEDPRVGSLSFQAWALWYLGYPDQALQRVQEALALGQELASPYNRAFTLSFATWLHQLRGDREAVRERAETTIALSNEHGFPFWLSLGTVLSGWAMSAQGQHEEGVARILRGIAVHRQTGGKSGRSYFLALLAEAYREAGRVEEALDALIEPLATLQITNERFYEAELYRQKGELRLMQPDSNIIEAERLFRASIETAQHQQAKSLELRATTSLARLLASQGRRDEARTILAEIYNWFTEGFDTADLKDAKALLNKLAS
jgi:predicted ATPase